MKPAYYEFVVNEAALLILEFQNDLRILLSRAIYTALLHLYYKVIEARESRTYIPVITTVITTLRPMPSPLLFHFLIKGPNLYLKA